ncbi:MAG: DNA polymerase III subunit delta [Nitrospinota bacterium]
MAAAPGAAFQEALRDVRAGRIAPLYLLHGEEDLLQDELLAEIEARLVDPSTADFNSQRLDAEQDPPEDVRNAAETLPFLGERRLVVVRRAESLEGKVAALGSCLEDPPESACLVLMASVSLERDRRQRGRRKASELVRQVRRTGVVVPTDPLKGRALAARVGRMASRLGLSLDDDGLALLVDRTGGSLRRAASELEKLSLHVAEAGKTGGGGEGTPARRVSLETVAEVVDDGRTENLFDLTDALGARNIGEALDALERLLRRQLSPSAIVSAMGRHFVRLLEARAWLDEGVPLAAVPDRLGGSPYYARKLAGQARRFSDPELRAALQRLRRTDLSLKGSGLPDRVVLEKTTMDLCLTGATGGGDVP